MQKMYRLKPAEVAAEAGISTSSLQRVYKDDAPVDTRMTVAQAIERCRKRLLSNLECRAVG
jgi:hypothetical protein